MTPDDVAALRADMAALIVENERLRELVEIRSLGIQMASEQRDEVIAIANERADALARVRALCEQPDVALLNVNVIRAAIEGTDQ